MKVTVQEFSVTHEHVHSEFQIIFNSNLSFDVASVIVFAFSF